MADLAGFVSAFKAVSDAVSGVAGALGSRKANQRKRAARVCGHISTSLDRLLKALEALRKARNSQPDARANLETHKALEEIRTYVEELSNVLKGAMNRRAIGALRLRLNALVAAREDVINPGAIEDELLETVAATSGRFLALANALA